MKVSKESLRSGFGNFEFGTKMYNLSRNHEDIERFRLEKVYNVSLLYVFTKKCNECLKIMAKQDDEVDQNWICNRSKVIHII